MATVASRYKRTIGNTYDRTAKPHPDGQWVAGAFLARRTPFHSIDGAPEYRQLCCLVALSRVRSSAPHATSRTMANYIIVAAWHDGSPCDGDTPVRATLHEQALGETAAGPLPSEIFFTPSSSKARIFLGDAPWPIGRPRIRHGACHTVANGMVMSVVCPGGAGLAVVRVLGRVACFPSRERPPAQGAYHLAVGGKIPPLVVDADASCTVTDF